jgi:hypothetical protein
MAGFIAAQRAEFGIPYAVACRALRCLRAVVLQLINSFLMKWAMRKYKRLRRAKGKTRRKLAEIASTFPAMSAH